MTNAELIAWQNRVQSPIEKALRRAYQLGQTYWQQADSESYKQNRLSDETRQKFEDLVTETAAALLEPVGEGDASLIERLKMEAQIHAQEARTANATIAEIYQIVTGKTGEPGNWHGAEPVRKCIEELRAAIAASPKSNGGMGS